MMANNDSSEYDGAAYVDYMTDNDQNNDRHHDDDECFS